MITNPFNLLQTAGIGLAVVLVVAGIQEVRYQSVKSDRKELRTELSTCSANLTTARNNGFVLEEGIKSQNGAIEANAAQGRADQAAATEQADKALADAKERTARAARAGVGPDVMNKFTDEIFQ